MLVGRPQLRLGFTLTPVAVGGRGRGRGRGPGAYRAADGSRSSTTCSRATTTRAGAFGVRLHSFDAAVERALRDWELTEEVAAR